MQNFVDSTISDVRVEPVESSPYMRLHRAKFTFEDGRKFQTDFLRTHDSVSILLYHTDRRALIVVRQFRPPVYFNRRFPLLSKPQQEAGSSSNSDTLECGHSGSHSGSLGYTYELCDGLIDKPNLTAVETARQEILEECGYDVACEKIEKIANHVSPESGAVQTIFYAEVDDSMKVSEGGGNACEQEEIDVVYVPIDQARKLLIDDESIQRCSDLMFCVLWFLGNK